MKERKKLILPPSMTERKKLILPSSMKERKKLILPPSMSEIDRGTPLSAGGRPATRWTQSPVRREGAWRPRPEKKWRRWWPPRGACGGAGERGMGWGLAWGGPRTMGGGGGREGDGFGRPTTRWSGNKNYNWKSSPSKRPKYIIIPY